MIDIKYVREFMLLSECCNFARAAEELFISQSALSKHIMALEKYLGHTLFTRSTRRVALTDYGNRFIPYAQSLMASLNECEAFITANNGANIITVGTLRSLYLYPEISDCLSNFPKLAPEFKLNIIQGATDSLVKKLQNHECDLIIVREVSGYEAGNCSHATIYTDPICIVLPESHPLASEKAIPLSSIANENFILPPEGSPLYPAFLKECGDAGFSPSIGHKLSSKEYSVQLVSQNRGCAIMGKSVACHYANPSVRVIPLITSVNENINIAYTKFSQLSPPAKKFLKFLKDSLLPIIPSEAEELKTYEEI